MGMYATADSIVNSAAQELGLGPASLAAGASDATGWQMVGLLNGLCQEIWRMHEWQNLEQIMEFVGADLNPSPTVVELQTKFPLPTDYGRQINQTQWANNTFRPMRGPVSAQQWSWLQYGVVSSTMWYQYRILDSVYQVYPAPPVGQKFSMYYISRNWNSVPVPVGDPPVYTDQITSALDVPQFDSRMLINGLKVKFWAQKGFDTTILQSEFMTVLNAEMSQIQGAPVLNLSGAYGDGLIGWGNVPDGTYNGGRTP